MTARRTYEGKSADGLLRRPGRSDGANSGGTYKKRTRRYQLAGAQADKGNGYFDGHRRALLGSGRCGRTTTRRDANSVESEATGHGGARRSPASACPQPRRWSFASDGDVGGIGFNPNYSIKLVNYAVREQDHTPGFARQASVRSE
jgi:hypothetical protein